MLKPKLTTIFDRSVNPLNATMEPLKKQNGVYAENATCMVNGNTIILFKKKSRAVITRLTKIKPVKRSLTSPENGRTS